MQIEKVVYFVRHGQSNDNAAPVFQSPESPLSDKGREQARSIAERVSKISFEALIASPFERAKETAEVIAKTTGRELEYSDLFVERMKPASINGKSHEDREADALWREWRKSLYTPGMRVADGENFDDIISRADRALAFLKDRAEKSMVVVTHGYFLRTMIARVLLGELLSAEALRRFQHMSSMENTGLTVLRYHGTSEEDSSWRLWVYNDHAHLG
jgi:ribonuclease H / adenosylcobalamin/alpha-ribazole phosphatase